MTDARTAIAEFLEDLERAKTDFVDDVIDATPDEFFKAEERHRVARRVGDTPGSLAGCGPILASPADQRDVAAFWALIGHEDLFAVGLDARAGEGVAFRPRLRFLHAEDRVRRPASWASKASCQKGAGSFYKSGRSRNWLKIKTPNLVKT
jgi:hypothetical protein